MVTYRLATEQDIPALQALLTEITQHHGARPPSPEDLKATLSSILASDQHLLLLAEKEGHAVGMCALIFSQSTWTASPVCELQDVIVSHTQRRTRIGAGLIQTAQHIARQRGCTRMFLLAEAWNFGAHAFYRHMGFQEKTCLYFERSL